MASEGACFNKLPIEVIHEKKQFGVDVRFIVTSSFSEMDFSSIPKSQRLCNIAKFLVGADCSDKVYIELGLCPYTLSILQDDWNDGKRVHFFDLVFF